MPNLRSYSCRAKSTYATHCFVQFLNLGEAGALDGCGDDLRYAVAAFDGERFVSMIDHDDLEFTAIIAVDGAGRIRYADAVLRSEERRVGKVCVRPCSSGWSPSN